MTSVRALTVSHKLLTLRLSMAPIQTPAAPPEANSAPPSPEKPTEAKVAITALSRPARAIIMELRRGDDVHGIWTFTAKDMNVPIDPEAYVSLQNTFASLQNAFAAVGSGFERLLPGVGSFAAQSAYQLSEKFPSVVKLSFLDDVRQRVSATPSLPLYVCDALRRTLDTLDRDRKILWLEFAEPIGYLPWLAWEQMLRDIVGVPIIRAGRQPVDALAPKGTLDALVAVSGCEPIAGAPKSIVGLCRQILQGVPAPNRCVIHVFADVLHRDPVRAALTTSGLAITEGEEPQGRRGVVVYPLPENDYMPTVRPGDVLPSVDALLEHQWPRWIRDRMRGRGLDVIHIVSEAGFPALHPSLEVAAIPWKKPERTSESYFKSSTRLRLRQVDAPQIVELASSLGAWSVVLSAPSADAVRAQRALTYQMSGLLPGVFVVHDLTADADAKACAALYAFLSRSPKADGSLALPDSTFLCVQCHPSRVLQDSNADTAPLAFGAGFIEAAKLVTAAFETQEATPAWAAALQRQIEQSVSGYLGNAPANARDKAAQEGVLAALTKAMEVIAKHTKPTT